MISSGIMKEDQLTGLIYGEDDDDMLQACKRSFPHILCISGDSARPGKEAKSSNK